jgi:hypothetical protein
MKWFMLFLYTILLNITLVAQGKAKQLLTTADKRTIPEGIAIDQRSGTIYISSINQHKILKIDRKGRSSDFLNTATGGFLEGLGMKIDEKRNLLWALSNKKEKEIYTSRLQAFDLKTGLERVRYTIQDTAAHLFNDLVLVNGTIYITDTYFSAIYQFDTVEKKLTLYKKHEHLTYPNGITADLVSQRLFIASYKHGIVMIDLQSNESYVLSRSSIGKQVLGLDGLVFFGNSLMGVYNLEHRSQHAVMQYFLSADGKSIRSEKIIDHGNALFYEPTTAALRKEKLYVIANSYLGLYNANKESTSGVEEKLTAPTILVYKLKK